MKTNKELTDFEIIEKEVTKYVEKNNVSPFANIEMLEDGTLNVDMDQEFEKVIQEQVQDISEAFGRYFETIIKEMVEKLESGEVSMDDFVNPEDSPEDSPEAP